MLAFSKIVWNDKDDHVQIFKSKFNGRASKWRFPTTFYIMGLECSYFLLFHFVCHDALKNEGSKCLLRVGT